MKKETKEENKIKYDPILTSVSKTNFSFKVTEQMLNEISQFGTVIVKFGNRMYRFEDITVQYKITKQLLK